MSRMNTLVSDLLPLRSENRFGRRRRAAAEAFRAEQKPCRRFNGAISSHQVYKFGEGKRTQDSGHRMDENHEGGEMVVKLDKTYFMCLSVTFLLLLIISMAVLMFDLFPVMRWHLTSFAASMLASTLLTMSMVKSVIVHDLDLEDKERDRLSDERRRNSEMDHADKEAERIRASEQEITVIWMCGDE